MSYKLIFTNIIHFQVEIIMSHSSVYLVLKNFFKYMYLVEQVALKRAEVFENVLNINKPLVVVTPNSGTPPVRRNSIQMGGSPGCRRGNPPAVPTPTQLLHLVTLLLFNFNFTNFFKRKQFTKYIVQILQLKNYRMTNAIFSYYTLNKKK